MTSSPVTMVDVAKAAGVTHITVSRALSGKGPVSTETRQKVMEAAESLGYRPSVAARATRTGRTGLIGMLLSPKPSFSVHASDLGVGLDETLHSRGLCLLRDVIDDQVHCGDPDAEAPRIIRENAVDGLLINYAFGTPPAVRDVLDRCRVPAIWINRRRDANCVRPDDEGAAYEATRYMLEHGHTSIAMLCGSASERDPSHADPHYSGEDRVQGYIRAMREAGLKPRCDVLASPAVEYAPGHKVDVRVRWLAERPRPTAVLCEGDGPAMMIAAMESGVRVPEDLSVMTFDNIADSDTVLPIDRVLIRYRAMGHAAVDEICALVENPTVARRPIVIPMEFHRLGTVAEPQRT